MLVMIALASAACIVAAVAIEADSPEADFGVAIDAARRSNIRSDERVIFFPTIARRSDDGSRWVVPIHAWVFEPEEDDLTRGAALGALKRALDLPDGTESNAVFDRRARWFLVDNERGKRLTIRIGDRAVELAGETGTEGHLHATIELPGRMSGAVEFAALLGDGDGRAFTGVARLLEPAGLTIISDIDDTVKVSHVLVKRALMRKTFLEPFEAVPGMAERYRKWSDDGAAVLYVSSSPWQLYPVLSEGLSDAGFPAATFYLKEFRVKDSRILDLFADPLSAKLARIESIISAHPQRDYILIGDSGEKDPEVYTEIARRYPDRVREVWIRAAPLPPGVDLKGTGSEQILEQRAGRLYRDRAGKWQWEPMREQGGQTLIDPPPAVAPQR